MWEIYAYFNTEALVGLLNAAAAIHASGDYTEALAAVVACGFLTAMIAYAFAPEKLLGWQWLASVCLVYSLLILPRATVGVVDRTGNSPVQVVDNVPFGLAALASISSSVGHTLTQLFETTFQVLPGRGNLPSELTYQRSGLLFGNRLVRHTRTVVFPDPAFRTDTVNFLLNCTRYDLSDGTIDPAVFALSEDVWSLMATPNPARFTSVWRAGRLDVDTCPNVYRELSNRLPAQVERIQGTLAAQLNPTLPGPAAAAVIAPQIQQAYQKNQLAQAASTASSLILQNAMLNAVEDAGAMASQRSNDPAAMVLGASRAQAIAQQNAGWLSQGKLAEQALPVLRNVIEALVIALFPLVVLMLMLTSGRQTLVLLKGYVSLLIWIQLWPPLYAVLNYMATLYAAQDLAAAADMGGLKGLSLQTASMIYSRAISGEAVVGYLTLSVPLIAWAVVQRLESIGTTLGLVSALQGKVASNAANTASGNVNLGNLSLEQMLLSPNRTSAFMQSMQSDINGNTYNSNMLNGTTAVNMLRNQGFASRTVAVSTSQQEVHEASRQADAARSEALSAAKDRSAVVAEAFNQGVSQLSTWRESDNTTRGRSEEMGKSVAQLQAMSEGIQQRTGYGTSEVARLAFAAQAKLGLSLRVKDEQPPMSKKERRDREKYGSPAESSWTLAGSGLNVHADAGKTYQASLTDEEAKVVNSMTNDELQAFARFAERLTHDKSWAQSLGSDERQSQELSSRLATTTSRAERSEATYAERVGISQRLSSSYQSNETISVDQAQDPRNIEMISRYTDQYGRSAAAQTLMSSELARQSLKPNLTFSDGTAVPATFQDVRPRFESDKTAPALKRQPQVQRPTMENLARTSPDESLSAEVQRDIGNANQLLGKAHSDREAEWEKKSQVTRSADGHVTTQRSLMKDTSQLVVDDANQVLKEGADIMKSVIKR